MGALTDEELEAAFQNIEHYAKHGHDIGEEPEPEPEQDEGGEEPEEEEPDPDVEDIYQRIVNS